MQVDIRDNLLSLLDRMEESGEDTGNVRFKVGDIEWKIQASIEEGSVLNIRVRPRTAIEQVDLGDII